MSTPPADTPQPRDIALEVETPEQAADLEAQSESSEEPASGEEATGRPG